MRGLWESAARLPYFIHVYHNPRHANLTALAADTCLLYTATFADLPVQVLFDTGADDNVISLSFARQSTLASKLLL